MAEIALRTTERKLQRTKYLAWRPVGSAMICQSDHTICRKWIEICCDLVSPKKRNTYQNIPGWSRLCDAWTPALREAWLEADRPTNQWKLSRLLQDHTYSTQLWNELIVPIGVDKDLPLAPESDVKIHHTWLWSEIERKKYFIVINTDADSPTIDNWNGHEERDADTGDVLPLLTEGQVRDPGISFAIMPKKQCKYEIDIGLTGSDLDKISNPEIIVHPKFEAPVISQKFIRPVIAIEDTKEL